MKTNYLVKHFIGTFLFFAIIFISAGRINYWQGLIYVTIGLIMSLLNYTVLRIDSELLNERSKPGEGTKKWDKTILGLSFLLQFPCILLLDLILAVIIGLLIFIGAYISWVLS